MQESGVGAYEAKRDASEAIADIPQNKTLFINKLTGQAPVKPEITKGLKNIDDVFEKFQPNIDVEFSDEEGLEIKENLNFNNLGDFGSKGIINQSKFLVNLNNKQTQYNKIIKQLKSNKVLMKVMNDPEAKKAFLQSISALLAELEGSK
ncbi:MAG: hypothetical protein U9R19_00435 [Bacteroidota bacterium]|nr:hypothetical protein [Bacteroidota bacterium]